MDVTAKDAARLLDLPEKQIHAWILNGTLPCYRIKDRYRLNRVELLNWAAARNIKVAPEYFRENRESSGGLLLTNALAYGGVLNDVAGKNKVSVLREVCTKLKLPSQIDRQELHSILVAREALCSTGIGNGIAIPHPRGPIMLGLTDPHVTLAFLCEAIDYSALDKKPVSVLFVIISTTVHTHLTLLSHLMFALQDAEFRALLGRRADEESILAKSAEIERRVVQADKAKGATR